MCYFKNHVNECPLHSGSSENMGRGVQEGWLSGTFAVLEDSPPLNWRAVLSWLTMQEERLKSVFLLPCLCSDRQLLTGCVSLKTATRKLLTSPLCNISFSPNTPTSKGREWNQGNVINVACLSQPSFWIWCTASMLYIYAVVINLFGATTPINKQKNQWSMRLGTPLSILPLSQDSIHPPHPTPHPSNALPAL